MINKIFTKLNEFIDRLYRLNDHARYTIIFSLALIQALFAFFTALSMQLMIPTIICFSGIFIFIGAFILSKKNKIHTLYKCILIYAFFAEIAVSFFIDSTLGFQNYLFVLILMGFTFLYTQKSYRDLVLHTLFSFVLISLCFFLCAAINIYITPCKFLPPAFTLFVRSLNNFLVLSLLFMYTLMFVIKLFQLRTQVELQNKQEIEHQKLALMLAQIKPHFMYNTLICIDSLIDTDPQTARQLLLHFSQYMRANIDSLTDNDLIPFSEELSHTLTYVDIISICFNHEIHLELNLKEENFSIPPLTLQPIVENAIKHGKLIENP